MAPSTGDRILARRNFAGPMAELSARCPVVPDTLRAVPAKEVAIIAGKIALLNGRMTAMRRLRFFPITPLGGVLATVLFLLTTGCPDDGGSDHTVGDAANDTGGDGALADVGEDPLADATSDLLDDSGPGSGLSLTGGRLVSTAGTTGSARFQLAGHLVPSSGLSSSASWRLVGNP